MIKTKNEISCHELRVCYDPWKLYRFQSQEQGSIEKNFTLGNDTVGWDIVLILYQNWLNKINLC